MKRVSLFLGGVIVGAVLTYPIGVGHGIRSSGTVTALGDKLGDYRQEFDQAKIAMKEIGQDLEITDPKAHVKETFQKVGLSKASEAPRVAPEVLEQLNYGLTVADCHSRMGTGTVVTDLRGMGTPVEVMMWLVDAETTAMLTFQDGRLCQMTTIPLR